MPVLPNNKHELFAQGLAKGLSADAAYQAAGYKPHRGNAARLRANEIIQRRIAEILGKAAEKAEVNKAWLVPTKRNRWAEVEEIDRIDRMVDGLRKQLKALVGAAGLDLQGGYEPPVLVHLNAKFTASNRDTHWFSRCSNPTSWCEEGSSIAAGKMMAADRSPPSAAMSRQRQVSDPVR